MDRQLKNSEIITDKFRRLARILSSLLGLLLINALFMSTVSMTTRIMSGQSILLIPEQSGIVNVSAQLISVSIPLTENISRQLPFKQIQLGHTMRLTLIHHTGGLTFEIGFRHLRELSALDASVNNPLRSVVQRRQQHYS